MVKNNSQKRTRPRVEKKGPALRVVMAGGSERPCIFQTLSVALELRRSVRNLALTWVSGNNRKVRDVCREHRISLLKTVMRRGKYSRIVNATTETIRFVKMFGKERPRAVVAFGGQECIPVLTAARIRSVPYYLYEQDSVPSLTGRLFGSGAKKVFMGFPPAGPHQLNVSSELTGVPVRNARKKYDNSLYPAGFDKSKKTILIAGSFESSVEVNEKLTALVSEWASEGLQIIWQTLKSEYRKIKKEATGPSVFVFDSLKDRYPFYAVSRIVICGAEADLLSEIAYFGLPCVVIPGTTARDDYRYINAGVVDMQGWGFRVAQKAGFAPAINRNVKKVIGDDSVFEKMSRMALDHAPFNSAARITRIIYEEVLKKN